MLKYLVKTITVHLKHEISISDKNLDSNIIQATVIAMASDSFKDAVSVGKLLKSWSIKLQPLLLNKYTNTF